MPYPARCDAPGSLHHVWNRGGSGRTTFETRRDIRAFLYPIACSVRRGRIVVLSYAFLTNHFHFLIRSRTGELSSVIQLTKSPFVRHFNRTRDRNSALFDGRFRSRRIESDRGRRILIDYIHDNPRKAKLADDDPRDYEFCSAYYLREDRKTPPWLDLSWARGLGESGSEYRPMPARLRRLVEARIHHSYPGPDPLDNLLAAASDHVYAWLVERTLLADQTRPGLPVVDTTTVMEVCERYEALDPNWWCNPSSKRRKKAWGLVRAALLRDLAGATYAQAAGLLGCSPPTVSSRYDAHSRCLGSDEEYGRKYTALAQACLATCHG